MPPPRRGSEAPHARVSQDNNVTTWWCWGNLNDCLKGRKLHAYQKGFQYNDVGRPSDEEIDEGGWVLGEHPSHLGFEDRTGGGYEEFQIVE